MSNNRIDKFENINSLKDASQLQELALDGNPLFHHKGYFEFCLTTCPGLKHLDLRKITPEMRDTNIMPVKDKIMLTHGNKNLEDSNGKSSDNGNVSTDISPDK